MDILNLVLCFIVKYWDSILVCGFIAVLLIYMIKAGQGAKVKKILFALVTKVENDFSSGTGALKKAEVTRWVYENMPAVLKLLFTEKDISNIIEAALDEAKDKWDENPDLLNGSNTEIEPEKEEIHQDE